MSMSQIEVSVFFSEWNSGEVHKPSNFPVTVQQRLKNRSGFQLAQSLSAYALCRKALKMLGDPDAFETIAFEQNGKPVLSSGLQISITHSEHILAVAIGNCSLGLDLESQKEIDLADLEFVFHPDQLETIRTSENPRVACYDLWTQKEAAAKMSGQGIRALNSDNPFSEQQFFYPLKVFGDFSCTLCTCHSLSAFPNIIVL